MMLKKGYSEEDANRASYIFFNDLISAHSMRNIFGKNDKRINYKNYNDIIYNLDMIEEELGKKLIYTCKQAIETGRR